MAKKHWMSMPCFVTVLLISWITRADVIVGAGERLAVTNTDDIGFAMIQMDNNATLEFLGSSVATGGLNEYTRDTTILGAPFRSEYGTWSRVATNVYWASTNFSAAQTEYIYTGRWYIPEPGVYSFYEHIDDGTTLAVDGKILFWDMEYNVETCVQDITLKAGWHDLEIRVFNNFLSGGIVSDALKCGILYSPSNDLISVSKQPNAYPFVDSGDGSVLQNVHNGRLFQKTLVDGEVTFDLSGHGLAAPLVVSGGLYPLSETANAKVTVKGGSGELLFGSSGATINFPPFNVDVVFSGVADPVGVTFRDQSTVVNWPTSCTWRVANDAVIALAGTNLLGASDVVLTNHNIYALSAAAVANGATIRVQGTNLTASIKPCTINTLGEWYGRSATFTNNVSLEGENAKFELPVNAYLYLQGAISGTGTVVMTGSSRAEILEVCDFVGPVVCNNGTLIFDSVSAGHSNNTVIVGTNATVALYPAGYGSNETTTWIKRLGGNSLNGKVFIPAKQTMVVDYLDGMVGAQGTRDSGSVLHINTLGTNAVLQTVETLGDVSIEVDCIAPGASISLKSANTPLMVTGTENTLDRLTIESGAVPVSGTFTIAELIGAGQLVKTGDSTLEIHSSKQSGGIRIDAGTVRCSSTGSLPEVAVAAGATLEIGGSCSVSNVTGLGHVIVSDSATVNLSSIFAGTVTMAGGTLMIPDLADIKDERVVPASNRALWVDPCQTNRVVFGSTPTRPLAISALFDRMTDSRYLLGTYFPADLTYDRRPWLSVTNSPLGNTLYWIDFENTYEGDTKGNTLRLNTNPAFIDIKTTAAVPTNVQSGFIVLDSSRGGGVPITYDVAATQVVTRDNPQSVSSPIWGSGTTTSLKSGATYLDGKPVNGATRGYSGRNELLSFVATNIFQAAYFGYYGLDNYLTPNRERLGEIILLDTVVNETTRADIEAYLMKKWLGEARAGYSDMTEATVSGSGELQAFRPTQLPQFDPEFTGSVTLSGTVFDWSVDKNAVGEFVTTPTTVIPGTLSVAATGTINVNFAVKPPAGKYTLMTYGSISGAGFQEWALNMTGYLPSGSVTLKATATELFVFASQGGLILIR